jgi:N utilization substance protein B
MRPHSRDCDGASLTTSRINFARDEARVYPCPPIPIGFNPAPMGTRRKAREMAVQILYQMEMKESEPKQVFDLLGNSFWEEQKATPPMQEFTIGLVEGAYRNRMEIDQQIEVHSTHWKLPRMAAVDRNILRLGVYELLYLNDVPTNVILDEAIELGKKFGTVESGSFINGILDNVAKEVRK